MKGGRDILSEYGRDISKPQAARATSGGCTEAKPLSYSPPVGPKNMGHEGPGIPGDRHGMARCPVASSGGGSPGLGTTAHRGGSQRG